ncbi:sialidase family protein [Rhizobium bangladeshense]|uniref:sialidase family protein n=1 Tax=Rhizobium bangladeshense TaxID=1138189 RepID=UPI001C83B8C1|nr:exo-alpha-sialidase [Rhizobium bangladeshense]MBX4893186.1 glycosyl hydrolase [Rhizobium bangladeshense]
MQSTGLKPEEVPSLMDGVLRANIAQTGRFDAYLPSPCVQNHAANLAFLADGTLTCVWFGGTMEGMGDISIYMSRLAPDAERWTEPEKMSDDPAKSEQNPLIFNAPDGRVWLLYTSQTSGDQDGAVVKCRVSQDGGKSFAPPSILCDLPGTFVRQQIVVNGKGQWLLPIFRCGSLPGRRWSGDADTAGVMISGDGGKTWQTKEIDNSLGAVHMNIVPLEDDRMVAFFRDRYAENIHSSLSTNQGETWSTPKPIDLPNNNSSIQAINLRDRRIAMVYNHSSAASHDARRQSLYDEVEATGAPVSETSVATARKAVWGVPRAPLSLAVSIDEGAHFERKLDLDTGDGYCLSNNSKDLLNREFSYPSITQGPDGALHVAYTYYRRAIKYVRLPLGSIA